MAAAVYVGDGRLAVKDVPVPDPGPDESLVEIAACGICGSDLHLVLEKYARSGAILGHEWSGLVVEGGSAPHPSGDAGRLRADAGMWALSPLSARSARQCVCAAPCRISEICVGPSPAM